MGVESAIFAGPSPSDVPLASTPLVCVISQIRFPMIASIERPEYIAGFQESIRTSFPEMRREEGRGVSLGPDGIHLIPQGIWRFRSADGTMTVSLSLGFIALEARVYKGRTAFLEAWTPVVRAAQTLLKPARAERVGLRYVNRLDSQCLASLPDLVRSEVLGIVSLEAREGIRHTMAEAVFGFGEDSRLGLLARWGLLGQGMTHDPTALPPVDERSWVLDIDAFSDASEPFETEALVSRLHSLGDADYRFFRWATTDAFLRRFGGLP